MCRLDRESIFNQGIKGSSFVDLLFIVIFDLTNPRRWTKNLRSNCDDFILKLDIIDVMIKQIPNRRIGEKIFSIEVNNEFEQIFHPSEMLSARGCCVLRTMRTSGKTAALGVPPKNE